MKKTEIRFLLGKFLLIWGAILNTYRIKVASGTVRKKGKRWFVIPGLFFLNLSIQLTENWEMCLEKFMESSLTTYLCRQCGDCGAIFFAFKIFLFLIKSYFVTAHIQFYSFYFPLFQQKKKNCSNLIS